MDNNNKNNNSAQVSTESLEKDGVLSKLDADSLEESPRNPYGTLLKETTTFVGKYSFTVDQFENADMLIVSCGDELVMKSLRLKK